MAYRHQMKVGFAGLEKYVDGHVVRNTDEFVTWDHLKRRKLLTEWANAHVDECCLRFVRVFVQKGPGRYVYGRMYYDADYLRQNRFYLSGIVEQEQRDEIDAKEAYIERFPKDFKGVLELLRKQNRKTGKGSNAKLAEFFHMEERSFARWIENPRCYRNEDFLTALCLYFELPDWLSSLVFRRAHFQLDEGEKRHRALQHILRVQSADGIEAANRLKTESIVLDILYGLVQHFSHPLYESDITEPGKDQERIRRILEYIEAHYTEPISLSEIAGEFGLSREYFSRLFRQTLGITLSEHINRVRISHFYHDLVSEDTPVMLLLEKNGLTNYKLFIRTFKEIYGYSPRMIRKMVLSS